MSTRPRFYLDGDDNGWALVMDERRHDCVASFAPPYRDLADEMVARLNVRELAVELRAAPNAAPGFRRIELPPITEDAAEQALAYLIDRNAKLARAAQVRPPMMRNPACPHPDEDPCGCQQWVPVAEIPAGPQPGDIVRVHTVYHKEGVHETVRADGTYPGCELVAAGAAIVVLVRRAGEPT